MAIPTKQNKKEVREFIASIDNDFYLDLNEYSHFTDKTFETTKLSITQLLQICESFDLRMAAAKHIENDLDVQRMISLVIQRVNTCGCSKLAKQAMEIISNMDCYSFAKTKKRKEKIKQNVIRHNMPGSVDIGVDDEGKKSVFV